MKGLTQRQAAVLTFATRYLLENHTHASLRAIGEAMGIRSTNGVREHIRALVRKGYMADAPKHGELEASTWRIVRTANGQPFALGNVARYQGNGSGSATADGSSS